MKKLHLFMSMALMFTIMYAHAERRPVRHHIDEPVKIVVRGVEFFIFPDGEFDFNAHTPHHRPYHRGDYAVRVERDRFGRIRRVGNVFLNYNTYGQIARIGHVFIKYNRRGLVRKIGRKHLRYHRHGYVVFWKKPYRYRPAYDYTPACSYGTGFFDTDEDDFFYNDYEDTSEVYYLRNHKGKKAKNAYKKKQKKLRNKR